ncbi:MAG: hypothetical protein ACO1RA_08610 [Planctomycetaceae bacterium]
MKHFLNNTTRLIWCVWGAALMVSGALGCGTIQVPAIDPSGERIFSGSTTQLTVPRLRDCPLLGRDEPPPVPGAPIGVGVPPPTVAPIGPAMQPPCQPGFNLGTPGLVPTVAPACPVNTPSPFVVPAVPVAMSPAAPCEGPKAIPVSYPAPSASPECKGNCPQIKIMPGTLVAPVGSDVVLTAGLCGPDGHFVLRQPLEWMLNPDGVGQIVQVGQETRNPITGLFSSTPNKVATNFAKAKTSSIAQTITRGTPTPADDLQLGKGQSWISITSPTEGTTHVTVVAPKEGNWDQRKQTATIYWVDARWVLPPCGVQKAGQRQILTTKLFRANGAPVPGWIVRYDFLEGPDASFGAAGEKSIEVTTRADGTASAELLPSTMESGISLVKASIIRPQMTKGDLPNMVIGQGVVSTTWTAPGLSVRALGTETAGVDGLLSYRVEVVNTGDTPAPAVQLSYTPPTGVQYLNSNPSGQPFGQRYVWNLGDLPPRAAAIVEVTCRAQRAADGVRSTFVAQSSDKLSAEGSVSTRIFASQLVARMRGADQGVVGQKYQFTIDLQNTGSTPLTNVAVRDTFDSGLRDLENRASPIMKTLGTLQPGETKQIGVSFIPMSPGKLCNRIEVFSEEGHTATASRCFTAVADSRTAPGTGGGAIGSVPSGVQSPLVLKVTGIDRMAVGQSEKLSIMVENRSQSTVTGAQLTVNISPLLNVTQATRGYVNRNLNGRMQLVWQIAPLEPNARREYGLQTQALQASAASVMASAILDVPGAGAQKADYTLQIVSGAIQDPGSSTAPSRPMGQPSASNLKVTIAEDNDPVRVGEQATYLIDVANEGQMPDEDVLIRVIVPPGMQFKGMREATGQIPLAKTARGVEIGPINMMAAGEKLPQLQIEVTATQKTSATFRVEVTSRLNPQAISISETTQVVVP